MNAQIERRLQALEKVTRSDVPYDRIERHIVDEPTIEARDARIAEIEAMSASDTLNILRIIVAAPDPAFRQLDPRGALEE